MTQRTTPSIVFQHLLREEDAAGLDPADLIAEASRAAAQTYVAMGGGFSAWYPTKLRSQRVNPHMRGDFLGGVTQAARAANMRVVARVDISKGRPEWIARDPDWFARKPDGTPGLVWEMPQICPTGPYWRDEAFAIVGEMMAGYRPDGLFFNYLYTARCHCARCAQIVRDATGADVPAPGVRSPVYEKWRRAHLADFVGRLGAHARSFRADVDMIPYHHVRDGWNARAMAAVSDTVSSQISNPVVSNPVDPQPQWPHWAAEEAMLARALKPDSAPLLAQTGSGFFASRQTAMPPHRMLRNMVEAHAFGASVMIAISGRLGGDDPRSIPAIENFARRCRALAPWRGPVQSLARVAVLRSQDSIDWGPDAGRNAGRRDGWGHVAEMRGVYMALSRLRYPADILPADALDPAMLARCAAVIAPAISCISNSVAAALDAYVAAGGTLIATGDFGASDENGAPRAKPACAALPALPGSSRALAGAYFLAEEASLRDRLDGAPHLGTDGPLWLPTTNARDGWAAGLRTVGPFANNAPEFAVVHGPGSDPGKLSRVHGNGRAVWFPWLPGGAYFAYGVYDHAAVLADALAPALGPPPIVDSPPGAVSYAMMRAPDALLLHVFNDATVQGLPLNEAVSIAAFEVAVACDAARAIDTESGREISLKHEGNYRKFVVDLPGACRTIALLD
ncbi:MAG: beta-galactosidase trimerization domain-containing protein [Alphaproteobacteria bacterium]|nr:beta-galactosidase trimerization domain-containing protein [Alphaproteobacteria bacterium]